MSILIYFALRYGTTTFSLPPYKVLHTDLIGNDPEKLKDALTAQDKPMAIVIPHETITPAAAKRFLMKSGLWFLSS